MKEIKILKFGNDYRFYDSFEVVEKFPNSTFEVKDGGMSGLYFQEQSEKEFKEKIFDIDGDFINHVILSYNNSSKSVGVLLKGKKGLGKSFTAQRVCSLLNLPIIKISSNFKTGTDLFSLLNQIQQEHILYIDEFDKIFSNYKQKEESSIYTQEDFLSFLDGANTSNTKKLFLITSNNEVNDFLVNRPSRLRYIKNYQKIEIDVVKMLVEDLLEDKQYKDDLLNNLEAEDLNIDILIQIISEINALNIPYTKFKSFFNYSVPAVIYKCSILENGEFIFERDFSTSESYLLERFKQGSFLFENDKGNGVYFSKLITKSDKGFVIEIKVWDEELEKKVIKTMKMEKDSKTIINVF